MIYKISQTLKLEVKNKSWSIHNFFELVSNNASSTLPFNATVIGYFDILIFWYFEIFFNNCPRFSQRCFFNSNFQVAHMRFFHHIFFCVEAKMWSHWSQSTHGFVTVSPIKCLPLKIGAYVFLPCSSILDSSNLMITRSSDLV